MQCFPGFVTGLLCKHSMCIFADFPSSTPPVYSSNNTDLVNSVSDNKSRAIFAITVICVLLSDKKLLMSLCDFQQCGILTSVLRRACAASL